MTINLTIVTPTGKRLNFDFEGQETTIDAVKEAVLSREGIPLETQRLIYKGKQLEDGLTIGDYNIDNGMELHLILRM
ncbi:ubiquitin-like domain-containing protein [Pseudomonas weihenstephanensis]|nr:ubiquitin-like domain-containing protein [Pseudomonas weihenstephanensis]